MGLEENKAVCNRVAELISQQDMDGLSEYMASPLLEDFRQRLSQVLQSFPDYHGTNIEQIAEGDKVFNRIVYYGTHQGEFMGIPPTGKQVTFRGVTVDRIENGKLVENWVMMDRPYLLEQLRES
jgi:predicted ester cyclase